MHISGSKVAIGAVVGAGIAAAAGLGIDGLIDHSLVQQGAEFTLDKLANSQELVNQGIAYYAPPTGFEQLTQFLSDKASQIGDALTINGSDITVQTLQGPAQITNVAQLQSLIAGGTLSEPVEAHLRSIVEQFSAHAAETAQSAVTQAVPLTVPDSAVTQITDVLKGQEGIFYGPNTLASGVHMIDPSSIDGLVKVPLSNGGELFVHPEKFAEAFNGLTQGATSDQMLALQELKSYTNPLLTGKVVAAGAGAGGALGAALSAMTRHEDTQQSFADRVGQRQAQALAARKSEGQPWAEFVQAEPVVNGPSVTR